MRKALTISVLALALVGLAASPAHALYYFFMREDLDRALTDRPETLVGQEVTFTDELVAIWPQSQERPSSLSGTRYVLFDTEYFHCAIPENALGPHMSSIWEDAQAGYGDVLERLERINDQAHEGEISRAEAASQREALYQEIRRVWKNRPIVTLFGTVERADFWGTTRGGVQTERLTIVVDRAEKPRRRWYEHGLDDG